MMFSRRGFLQTLAAAAVGAATFDPKSLLWVPAAPAPLVAVDLTNTTAAVVMGTQAELNDLALRFAREMTARLERHPSVALREIMYRHAGSVNLPPGSLDVDDLGVGQFRHAPRRFMKTGPSAADLVTYHANEMARDIQGERVDMFAPLGVELRPGEPFSTGVNPADRVDIGLATDPDSGLSVRVLRFQMDVRGGRARLMTGFEMAAGVWQGPKPEPRKRSPLILA